MIPQISKKNDYSLLPTTSVTGADPAANAEWSITVPSGERWLLQSVFAQLVQGATQTPRVQLIIDDGTNVLFQAAASTAQAASTTATYSFAPGFAPSHDILTAASNSFIIPIPANMVLEAGYRIRSNTVGKGANSDWGVPRATVIKLPASG